MGSIPLAQLIAPLFPVSGEIPSAAGAGSDTDMNSDWASVLSEDENGMYKILHDDQDQA